MTNETCLPAWQERLRELLPLFGHRNWIVVADAAYPAQANPGIETIATGAEQLDVVRAVAAATASCSHVRARILVDAELAHVSETDAPGIGAYREALREQLAGAESLPHEQIIHKLDEAASLFRVLLLKTTVTIPYTSVFFELDCGYWSAEAEERLRQAISG
ncbi:MAG: RbsD/FucU domain-containing protein [Terracidiphilus sp.]